MEMPTVPFLFFVPDLSFVRETIALSTRSRHVEGGKWKVESGKCLFLR